MRFVTYAKNGMPGIGLLSEDDKTITSLSEGSNALAPCLQTLIAMGDEGVAQARAALNNAEAIRFAAREAVLLAPLPRPRNDILCIGRNYMEHVKETDAANPVPTHPIIFTKRAFSVIGPEQDVDLHEHLTSSVDYEGEVAVVIGKTTRNVTEEEAMSHVFGYTVVNDVSARDIQKRHTQWLLGKSLDTFCPTGPCITHASAMPPLSAINVTTKVNGEVRQKGSVQDLIFTIPYLISLISRHTTLEPGDVIATGTPSGVGAGFTPPRFLRRGDTVEISVSGVGVLRNTFR